MTQQLKYTLFIREIETHEGYVPYYRFQLAYTTYYDCVTTFLREVQTTTKCNRHAELKCMREFYHKYKNCTLSHDKLWQKWTTWCATYLYSDLSE